MSIDITNSADIIDSRDIVARLEEIEEELSCPECGGAMDLSGDLLVCTDPECGAEMVVDQESLGELIDERAELVELVEEINSYSGDTARDGIMMIRDSYFVTYAQDFAEDIGAVGTEHQWPVYCIDWEWAARELQQDFTSAEYDGVTYWYR